DIFSPHGTQIFQLMMQEVLVSRIGTLPPLSPLGVPSWQIRRPTMWLSLLHPTGERIMSVIIPNKDTLNITQSAHALGGCKLPLAKNLVRRHVMLLATVSFALTALLALPAPAQDVLPRPEQSFKGYVGRVVKDSVKDFPQEV